MIKKNLYYIFYKPLNLDLKKKVLKFEQKQLYYIITSLYSKPILELKNTGFFFKSMNFFFFSFNILQYNNYYSTTFKSMIFSLWNAIASYNIIF